jgi:hypothetical protein
VIFGTPRSWFRRKPAAVPECDPALAAMFRVEPPKPPEPIVIPRIIRTLTMEESFEFEITMKTGGIRFVQLISRWFKIPDDWDVDRINIERETHFPGYFIVRIARFHVPSGATPYGFRPPIMYDDTVIPTTPETVP